LGSDTGGETFAAYLAKWLIVKNGYSRVIPAEAEVLRGGCDAVLCLRIGKAIALRCLVDREARPKARFETPTEVLVELALRIRKAERAASVSVEVFEIGPGATAATDWERLKGLKKRRGRVGVQAWALDTASSDVRTTMLWGGLGQARQFRRRLTEPRVSDAILLAPPPAVNAEPVLPWVSLALALVMGLVYAEELGLGIGTAKSKLEPTIQTLVAFGGSSRHYLLGDGEWYRLLTAAFVHGSVSHVLFNAIALILAGRVLEGMVGRAWFGAIFVLGAIGGSAMSALVNPPELITVGSSGAIMALFTAALVCSRRLPVGRRGQVQRMLGQVIIPALIPLATPKGDIPIDYGAHIGGTITGAALGLLLLRTWPHEVFLPRFRKAALGVIVAGAALLGVAVPKEVGVYHELALHEYLIPRDKVPANSAEGKRQSADLVARYPRDPRSQFWRGMALDDARDYAGAEHAFRIALDEEEILKAFFPPALTSSIRAMLALTLSAQGRKEDALEAARPVCAGPPDEPLRRSLGPLCR
jgi:rhomboid protease GluP